MLFGKNSDRERNEAQAVEYLARSEHGAGAMLRCTYITVPQVRRTNAALICRPFWIWGAEMGANEHGVVIGNEGLHARRPAPRTDALTGMDLVRLALERASTSAEAVEVIAELLARHGQGGNCGYLEPFYYHNGFMIVDATEAFVMETLDREWLIERVDGVRAMSNRYSIGRSAERISSSFAGLVRDSGLSTETEPNYADVIADPHREHIGNAAARRACATSLLQSRDGVLSVADMMGILRDHGTGNRPHPHWHAQCAVRRTVCMHAGAEDRPGQTVGALVSELHAGRAVHWVTATAAPCISIFKPVLLDAALPPQGPQLTERFDPATIWWRHEVLHRTALNGDFATFLEDIRAERDVLEESFRARVRLMLDGGGPAERSRVVAQCWQEAMQLETRWHSAVPRSGAPGDSAQAAAWTKMSDCAGVDWRSIQPTDSKGVRCN